MSQIQGWSGLIEIINKTRLLHTSPELMCELYPLKDFEFVKHLAVTVRDSRKDRPTFSLVYFWNPDHIDRGFVKLMTDRPLADIRNMIIVIQKNRTLSGMFDGLEAIISAASA